MLRKLAILKLLNIWKVNKIMENKLIDEDWWYNKPSFDEVKQIINSGVDVNAIDEYGRTPLIYAVSGSNKDKFKIVNILIENGADVNYQDKYNWNPLIMSIKSSSGEDESEIAKLLIENGADVNAKNENGVTVLMAVFMSEAKLENIRMLIKNGADVNAKDNNGKTTLQYAIDIGYAEYAQIINYLKSKGAK